jgi:metallo-beta-lactamase family protein
MTRDATTRVTLQFLGAAETVTGSKHLLAFGSRRVLLDCGLFQGRKELRRRNWQDWPFAPKELDAVILSHGHIDHSGGLPRLVRAGFRGPIYCTPGTADLLGVLLPDAAYLQEEEAAHANRHRYSKHKPALPLYTVEDAYAALECLEEVAYGHVFSVADDLHAVFRPAGHILGSATVDLGLPDGTRRLLFSGDLGRWGRPILHDPAPVPAADVAIVESTYGDRDHPPDPRSELAAVVSQAAASGGPLLVPAFAVGRTQELLWTLRELEDEGRVPVLPVYIDSPMAIDVTGIYLKHPEEHDLDMRHLLDNGVHPLATAQFAIARTVDQSKNLDDLRGPVTIISASGMATGGRILYHLKRWLPDRRATVLLVGFQAAGTRGRALQDGARSVRIHGKDVRVRARVVTVQGLSAHADRSELLRWLRSIEHAPRRVYLVHGEPAASAAFAVTLREATGWSVEVARDGGTVVV